MKIRNILCICGFIAAVIAAGISDGANLLGTEANAMPLAIVAALLMMPTLIHIVKEGAV